VLNVDGGHTIQYRGEVASKQFEPTSQEDKETTMTRKLAGKIALVTGGSRGIGAAIVRRFAEEGAHGVFTYVAAAVQNVASDTGATALAADAARIEDMQSLIPHVVERHGRLDILVNNAGVYVEGPIVESTLEDYDRVMNINVRATYLLSREAAKVLPHGGRIINIGSVLGERAIIPGVGLYASSKFAVAGLTRALAHDLGPKGITVNVVQPGATLTDMNPGVGERAEETR